MARPRTERGLESAYTKPEAMNRDADATKPVYAL
jgi:hypothetical protein